jgi:hypothetical protein
MTTYRIQNINGQFDHVTGKEQALARARQMVGAEDIATEADLHDFSVTIKPVSKAVAASVGLPASSFVAFCHHHTKKGR